MFDLYSFGGQDPQADVGCSRLQVNLTLFMKIVVFFLGGLFEKPFVAIMYALC